MKNTMITEVKNRTDEMYQSLSDEARAQYLVKALHKAKKRVDFDKLVALYKDALKVKRIDEERISSILNDLVKEGKVLYEDRFYYLPKPTVTILDQEEVESNNRLDYIIEKYFDGSFSENAILKDWFLDATISFFSSFTNAWISDLTNKESVVESKKDDIIKQIRNRTQNNKALDSRDKKVLADKFFKCITDKDVKVASYLWEYGTSAFSINLIKKTAGTDELSLSMFEGSKCILDTNILIDVALEGNERHDALDVLSEIFQELKVEVYTLFVTREEYKSKISSKYTEIQRLMVGNVRKAAKNANDQFMKAAVCRNCSEPEDFEAMFESLRELPTKIGDLVDIRDFPEDEDLEGAMKTMVTDEKIRGNFKTLYYEMHGWEKRDIPLNHDLSLLGAAEFLGRSTKTFVLSDDSTMNAYAKRQPYEFLPMAIRLDTLINVLALKKGGAINRMHSFQDMFANIVRSGFTSNAETFNINDLSYILDKDTQFASLESEKIEEIAKEVSRMRLQEKTEKEIARYLVNQFQREKLKIQGDFEEMKNKYHLEKEDNDRKTKQLNQTDSLLATSVSDKAKDKYASHLKIKAIVSIVCCLFLIPAVVYFLLMLLIPENSLPENLNSLIINIGSSVILDIIAIWKVVIPWVGNYISNKTSIIEKYKTEILEELEKKSSPK